MNLLAIDTSASSMTLGVRTASEDVYRVIDSGRKHSRDILPNILSILTESGIGLNQLDGLAFARGPGSFTGLRIAVGVVQGIAYGLSIPVIPVSNLAAIARKLGREKGCDNVVVALAAREQEVYMGAYMNCTAVCPELTGEEVVVEPANFPGLPDICFCGQLGEEEWRKGWVSTGDAKEGKGTSAPHLRLFGA